MKITFVNGKEANRVCEFVLPEITVGREDANVLRLPTNGVSRYHARFKQDLLRGGWVVCDQGSTNGVKVNGIRISGEYLLSEGDKVEIGEQILMVNDLSGEAPKIVFNPVLSESPGIETGPAPGTAVSNAFPAEPEPLPQDEKKLMDTLSGRSLFSGKKEQPDDPEKSRPSGKRKISALTFYTVLFCVAVVAVTSCVKVFSSGGKAQPSAPAAVVAEEPLYLYFEKVAITRDNVFRFSLKLENRKAVFVIDDIKSRRHPEPLVVENPPGVDVLRGRISSSGIWKLQRQGEYTGTKETRRRLSIMIKPQQFEMVVDGHRIPVEFEDVENAIYEFADGCGMQTVSMTGAELLQLARDNFNKAEDLFANREAGGSNLRDAVARYRVAVNYLSQFMPPPPMLKKAKAQLEEAERLRKMKLEELEYERVRLQNVRDFAGLRRVFLQVMDLADPGSSVYDIARKRLYIIDTKVDTKGSRR